MYRRILGFLLLGLLTSTPLLAADLSGNWQLDFLSQKGRAQTWTMMTFTADGGNLTIHAVHPSFGDVSGAGTLTGDSITMKFTLMGGNGPVIMDFEGTVKEGKMEGTRKFSYGPPTTGAASEGAKGGTPPGGDQTPNGGMPGGKGVTAGGAAPGGGQPSGAAAGGATGGEVSDAWTAVRK